MSDLLLSADQIDAARAAALGSRDGLDRIGFAAGYHAALHDLNGPMSMERAGIMYADIFGAANRSYDADGEDWLGPLVEERAEDSRIAHCDQAPSPAQPRQGWVYVLGDRATNCVKIGWTSGDVGRRASGVRNASGRDVAVVAQFRGTMADERKIHGRFDDARIRGEWFHLTSEIDAWIASL